jgi:hypothetical protein
LVHIYPLNIPLRKLLFHVILGFGIYVNPYLWCTSNIQLDIIHLFKVKYKEMLCHFYKRWLTFCLKKETKTTFNNISAILWRSVWLVKETGVARENHGSVASHWQSLSHNVFYFCPFCLYIHMSLRSCTMHMCVKGNEFPNVLWFFYYILELFRQCQMLVKVALNIINHKPPQRAFITHKVLIIFSAKCSLVKFKL